MKTKDPEVAGQMTDEVVQPESVDNVETKSPDVMTPEAGEATLPSDNATQEQAPDMEQLIAENKELLAYKDANEKANQKIMDALDAEPVLAKIIQDISMGASFQAAIARHIDPEDIVAQEGDPDYNAWEENRKARSEEMGKRKEFADRLAANQEMTKAEIKAFAEENGMSNEQAIEFLGQVDELFKNIYDGLIDRKTLALLKKAVDADQMVAEAREEGQIEGRNAKIKETIAPTKVGDGLPKIATSEDNPTPEPPKKVSYIDRLNGKV